MTEDVMVDYRISDTYRMNDYAITKWAGELMCLESAAMFSSELWEFGHSTWKNYLDLIDSCKTFANIIDNFVPDQVYNMDEGVEWEKVIKEYSDIVLRVTGKDDSLVHY